LRLWAGTIDFRQDMRIGDDVIKQIGENYRKIRNYFRFMLGNIAPDDFDPQKDKLSYEELSAVDKYLLVKLDDLNARVIAYYKKYEYLNVSAELLNFMITTLSAFYLDFSKDILYIEKRDSQRRRQVQSVLYETVDTLVRLWAPILSFTMEEIWAIFKPEKGNSIFEMSFKPIVAYRANELLSDFERFLAIKADVFKALEESRENKLIGKPLEAHVHLNLKSEDRELLKRLFDNIAQVFIVSQVSFTEEKLTQYEVAQVKISQAAGVVCPRCWNITESTHADGLCERCREILE